MLKMCIEDYEVVSETLVYLVVVMMRRVNECVIMNVLYKP